LGAHWIFSFSIIAEPQSLIGNRYFLVASSQRNLVETFDRHWTMFSTVLLIIYIIGLVVFGAEWNIDLVFAFHPPNLTKTTQIL
jgi:hypothetical protein